MNVTFRPIDDWPRKRGLRSSEERERSRFEAGWSATLDLLRYELGRLGADAVVVKLDLEDRDIRRDGWPRANARPGHPGVVVEWQVGDVWSRMAADKFDDWQDNARSIALSLEALRGVERWGAVEGEQYEGLRLELEAPIPPASTFRSADEAARFLAEVSASPGLHIFLPGQAHYTPGSAEQAIRRAYRLAAKNLHPDVRDGDVERFKRLQEARDVLLGEVRR